MVRFHPAKALLRNPLQKKDLRLFCIKFLGWLKGMARFKKIRPLEIDQKWEWSEGFIRFVNEDEDLSKAFEFREGMLYFRSEISPDECFSIIDFVNDNYRPPLSR